MLETIRAFFGELFPSLVGWLTNFFKNVVAPLGIAVAREVFDFLLEHLSSIEPTRIATA